MTIAAMSAIGKPAMPAALRTGILIVGAGVDDAAILVEGRRAGVEVWRLAAAGHGFERIAGRLAGRRDIAALHILCHGEPGALLIGGLGNDTFRGGLGADTISTGDGADLVVVGSSNGADVVTDFDGASGSRSRGTRTARRSTPSPNWWRPPATRPAACRSRWAAATP